MNPSAKPAASPPRGGKGKPMGPVRLVLWTLGILAIIAVGTTVATIVWFYVPDTPRSVLEKKYMNSQSFYETVAGIRLRVRENGPKTAPAIIMLHGFGSSLETWHYWEAPLSKSYRVVRYDLPGFGLTGEDPSGVYNDERDMEILNALMDRLKIQKAIIIGSSSGGQIAWKFAAFHPDRVDRLVLVSPDGFADKSAYGRKPVFPAIFDLFQFVSPDLVLRQAMSSAYYDHQRLTDKAYARTRDLMLAPGVRGAMIDRLRQNVLVDPAPILARIRAPTLVMWGRQDSLEPFENAQKFTDGIPGAKLVVFPKLGHIPFREDPDASLKPLVAFLNATAPTTAR
jgi:pimeloyl-ACP methyl ester carboxylesterase